MNTLLFIKRHESSRKRSFLRQRSTRRKKCTLSRFRSEGLPDRSWQILLALLNNLAMEYVYVMLSLKDNEFYTGYTADLDRRFEDHRQGRVNSTRDRRPLQLVYYEACVAMEDALKREKYLKTTWGKRYLRNRLKTYLKSHRPLGPKHL